MLGGADVLGFTLERFVNEVNGVWQEVAVCDGTRLMLWHGEDVPPGEGPAGSMTSSLRVVPLSVVTEVGCRRRLQRARRRRPSGSTRVDVYLLLSSLDEADLGRDGRPAAAGRTRCASSRLSTTAGRGRSPGWRSSPGSSPRWSAARC